MDVCRWYWQRFGSLLCALMVSGAWAEASEHAIRQRFRVAVLEELARRWKGLPLKNTLWREVVVLPEGRIQVRTTVLGHARAHRKPLAAGASGLAVFLWMLDSGAYSTLLGGVAFTWDNGGADNLANNATNWSPNSQIPGDNVGDTVTCDGTSTANITWNYNPTNAISTFTVAAAYSGTITLSVAQTTSWGAFSIAAGVFTTSGTNYGWTVTSVTQTGGTVTLNGSAVTCAGGWSRSAGTLNGNTSTVTFTASGNINLASTLGGVTTQLANITINGSVTMTATGNTYFNGAATITGTITGGSNFLSVRTASGNSWLGSGTATGTGARGVFVTGANVTADINFTGTWDATGIAYLGTGTTGASGTSGVRLLANLTISGASAVYVGNTGAIAYTGFVNVNGFTLTTHRIDMPDNSATSGYTGRLDLSTAGSAVDCNGPFLSGTGNYILWGSGTMSVSGNYDNRSTSASNDKGTGTLTLDGASPTWRQDNANADVYNLRVNISGTISTTTTRFGCTNQLRVSGGTLTPSVAITAVTAYLVDGGTLTWNNASSVQAAITASSGTLNITANDTFTGAQTWSGATVAMAATTQVFSSTVALSAGSLTISTGSITLNDDLTVSGTGVFAGNSAYTLVIGAACDLVFTNGEFHYPSGAAAYTWNSVTCSSSGWNRNGATGVTTTGVWNQSGGTWTPATSSLTVGGTLTLSAGTLGGNSAWTLDCNGNFELTGGTLSAPNASGTFTLGGATGTWSSGTFTHNSGTVTWDRAGNQTDTFSVAVTFNTITAGGSGTKSLGGSPCPTWTTKNESGGTFGGACITTAGVFPTVPAPVHLPVPSHLPDAPRVAAWSAWR